MKNKIKTVAGAVFSALCFLTVFFCYVTQVNAESGQLTHRHTGSRENGGGCYGEKKTSVWDCHSYNVSVGFNGTDYIYVCGQCGTRWSSPGKVDEPLCSGQGTDTYYEVNCGKNDAAAVTFSCEKSTEGWTKELDLTAAYSVCESGISISGFLWNGSPGGESYHVTQNGTYTLGLSGSGNVDFSPVISVKVDHIDNTAPNISTFQTASAAWGKSAELVVNASDAESGLASDAYSYDGGASWISSNTYTVTENGTYSVCVRDAVGNISKAETTVSTIDHVIPTISVSTSPSVDSWYDGDLTVTVHAQDAGSGLAETPYSFDGGATYTGGNSFKLSGSGTLEIAVLDKAGNVAHLSFHADKKQRPQPTPAPGGGNGSGGGTGSGNNSGNGNTGGGTGTGTGNPGSGIGTGGSGNGGTDSNGPGSGGAGNGSGDSGTGEAGTDKNSSIDSGVTGNGQGGSGNTGTGRPNGQGNQNTGGNGTNKGAGTGTSGSGSGNAGNGKGNDSSGTGDTQNGKSGKGSRNDITPSEGTGTLPQHYPGGLPRIGSMTGNRQNEYGAGSTGGTGDLDGNGGMGETDGNEWDEENRVEEAIVQNELLASANEQEAAILQRTGGALGSGIPYVSVTMLAACAVVLAAAGVGGWIFLFGVRIDTRDESGHYRFAGITRVTAREQERLRIVPLTKQIIRNAHTNELRIRFGWLCHKRYEGETLLLRYRSIKREFKVQRTVELHVRS